MLSFTSVVKILCNFGTLTENEREKNKDKDKVREQEVEYPLPNLPPGGGQNERWPTMQSGAFAKIAHQAILKRSALPLGETERGFIK
jgi:hypothetical protein